MAESISEKRGTPMTKSVDLTTLSGWANLPDGEHTITVVAKGTGYANSAKSAGVTVTKGSSTGETWVLNEEQSVGTRTSVDQYIQFQSNGNQYIKIMVSEKRIKYFYSEGTVASSDEVYYIVDGWSDEAYRTITFSTPPSGDLLAWLQANGTKQGGGQ